MQSVSRQFFLSHIIVIASVIPAFSQQRMGIAAGAIEMAANEVGQVATYCLDFSRASPKASDSYNHVLTGNESATVHFDNGTKMPLQQALQQHLVQMQGVEHVSFPDFINSMDDPAVQARHPLSAKQRKDLSDLRNLWNSSSPAQRRELEQLFEQATPDFADHTHLKIKNNTSQHLRVTFDDTTVLSPHDESLQGAAYTHIGHPEGKRAAASIQQQVWAYGDAQQQTALAYLGYYKGSVDGLPGPATKAAVEKFQSAHSLPLTGTFDPATTTLLHDRYNAKRLSVINSQKQGMAMVTITNTPGNVSGRYTVAYGQGGAKFATDSQVELAKGLNSVLASADSKKLYIDFDSFTDDRAKALTSSLRRQQESIDPSVELHGLTRSEADPGLQEIFLEKSSNIEAGDARIEEITSGDQKGFFRTIIDLVIHVGTTAKRISISVVSSTRAYAVELIQLIGASARSQTLRAASGEGSLSAAQIVAEAERTFNARHPHLPADSYSKQVISQFGTVDVSALASRIVPAA